MAGCRQTVKSSSLLQAFLSTNEKAASRNPSASLLPRCACCAVYNPLNIRLYHHLSYWPDEAEPLSGIPYETPHTMSISSRFEFHSRCMRRITRYPQLHLSGVTYLLGSSVINATLLAAAKITIPLRFPFT
jgi:hypothetical protein